MVSSICMFGDSLTKGVIFDTVRGKYRFYKDCFVNIAGHNLNIKVDNFSRFGCTIKKGSEIIKKHYAELDRYDYAALEFGGNDSNFDWAEISERPNDELFPRERVKFCVKSKVRNLKKVVRA